MSGVFLTMIFRPLLMKFTMTCSECVLLVLYHNMPKPVYIFINHLTAGVHCFVQRILRAPVERVPAHFSNIFFSHLHVFFLPDDNAPIAA